MVVPVLFAKCTSLPDNKTITLCCLHNLKMKLVSNEKFVHDDKQFISTLLERGFAETVSEEGRISHILECIITQRKIWVVF